MLKIGIGKFPPLISCGANNQRTTCRQPDKQPEPRERNSMPIGLRIENSRRTPMLTFVRIIEVYGVQADHRKGAGNHVRDEVSTSLKYTIC